MIGLQKNVNDKNIPLDKRIIFALDVDSSKEAKEWVERLESVIGFYKIGLQLFLAGGFDIVEWVVSRGHDVMLDLKFFDIPNTVGLAIAQLRGRGISFTTVHGNESILRSAVKAKGEVKVLAVTVLTSLDEKDIAEFGFKWSLGELVLRRAEQALIAGCDGIVSSGKEVRSLRDKLGKDFLIIVPGVRPFGNERRDDQRRVVTIEDAFKNGADYVVIGRPIREAEDPCALARKLQMQIDNVLSLLE